MTQSSGTNFNPPCSSLCGADIESNLPCEPATLHIDIDIECREPIRDVKHEQFFNSYLQVLRRALPPQSIRH